MKNLHGMEKEPGPCDGVTEALSRFLVRSTWAEVPPQVRKEAKRALLNFFATALAGSRDPAVTIGMDLLGSFSGRPEASVIGHAQPVDILTAAFLNAASANVFDYDDTHEETVIHPSAPVAPSVLALSERFRVSGSELLHAFILGIETECRIGMAVSPMHYRRGWHITATCGVFGAAAAAGKLLGLDERGMVNALGAASAQSGGLLETLGTMAKSIGVGNAARNGTLSALFAAKGYEGPQAPVEGRRGFARVTCHQPRLSAISSDLGLSWQILENAYKPYPCGVVLNPVIDDCHRIHREAGFSIPKVERIVVAGHPLIRERTDRPEPASGREAQVSAQHSVAVALLFGRAGLAEYRDSVVRDPAVAALRRKVQIVEDDALSIDSARITVTLTDRPALTQFVEAASGSRRRPLTDGDLEAKMSELVRYSSLPIDGEALIEAIWSLDEREDAGTVMKLCRPRGGQAI